MRVLKDFNSLTSYLLEKSTSNVQIGFVPTMGALHEGHLALVKTSLQENDITIASIFVNPTQFNESADFEKYPRVLQEDFKLLSDIGLNAVYTPNVSDIYPNNSDKIPLHFDFEGLDKVMEGAHRPGHFEGVIRVIRVFFAQINPAKAYFGEKDFQQLTIIRRLAAKEFPHIQIIPVETLRAEGGLALSSRNRLLSPRQRESATVLYKTLRRASAEIGKSNLQELIIDIKSSFAENKLVKLEYFEIADAQ
ncbi:MAG: pantoate--beta-alanine ligase, partial [Flavobacteriales bacterium]|nr:pantoate--beta-alanine ligase [Flavobacteriales bacterium]